MSNDNKYSQATFLIDSGSQISIINSKVSRYLQCKPRYNKKVISSVFKDKRIFSECDVNILLPNGNKESCNMSIVNNFNITVNFPNINDRISKSNEDGVPVCPNVIRGYNFILNMFIYIYIYFRQFSLLGQT